jgi:hypothetical protein
LLLGGFWDSKMDFQVEEDKIKVIAGYENGKLKGFEDRVLKAKGLSQLKDLVKVNYAQFLKVIGSK